ncbi:hypothetical protein ACHAW5_006459 [Stephanodiscus triporus]|uniref:Methyltransferase domain-containing protein n=1 Tax=Stephanodiscus triporus TaxID=2934178 RepID=A0ABD3NCM3_9STRA
MQARLVLFAATLLIINTNIIYAQSFVIMASWAQTWADILNGGPKRWKVDDVDAKRAALSHIVQHSPNVDGRPMRILCPLAGDDPFVHYAWGQGHDVTAIDIVPDALRAMRGLFGHDMDEWSSEGDGGNSGAVWKHKSGRATLLEGDILSNRPELLRSFDVIYDKDSFGALALDDRPKFCERISEFVKDGGTLYVEVKIKDEGRESGGPPYHVEKEDLMEPTNFGGCFEYVCSLGEVYCLNMGGMKQTGHVLRRAPRR